jgi:hypothetical protein
MSKSQGLSQSILNLLFRSAAIADLAENDTTTPATNLYFSLHTSSPGDTGTQTTNEITTGAYGQYARAAVNRTGTGFTAATAAQPSVTSPAANVDFAEATSGTGATITHFGIGTLISGTGFLMYHGTVTPNITIPSGGGNVTPRLTTSTTITET